jgi:hypothetical protein
MEHKNGYKFLESSFDMEIITFLFPAARSSGTLCGRFQSL